MIGSGFQTQFSGVLCFRCCSQGVGWVCIHLLAQIRGSSFPHFTQVLVGGIQFFLGSWTEGLSFCVLGPLLVPCHVRLSNMAAVSSKPASVEGKTENASKMEVTVFAKLISEVISHPFCCILFVKASCLVQPTFKGRRLYEKNTGKLPATSCVNFLETLN